MMSDLSVSRVLVVLWAVEGSINKIDGDQSLCFGTEHISN